MRPTSKSCKVFIPKAISDDLELQTLYRKGYKRKRQAAVFSRNGRLTSAFHRDGRSCVKSSWVGLRCCRRDIGRVDAVGLLQFGEV